MPKYFQVVKCMIILGERASLTKQANFTYRSWQPTARLVTPNPFLRFEESAFSFDHPSRKPRIIPVGTDCTQFELEPTLTALSCWPTKLQHRLVASPLAKVRTTQQLRTSRSSALSALTLYRHCLGLVSIVGIYEGPTITSQLGAGA